MNNLCKKYLFLFFFFTIGCSVNDLNREQIVRTASTAAGGYLGYEFSDGDIFSTTVGSTIGIILGDYLSEFINQDDYYFYEREALKVLEINDNSKNVISGYWKNPKTGNEGVIKIKGHYGSPECRLIEHIFIDKGLLNNRPSNVYDTACRRESGQWAMIK